MSLPRQYHEFPDGGAILPGDIVLVAREGVIYQIDAAFSSMLVPMDGTTGNANALDHVSTTDLVSKKSLRFVYDAATESLTMYVFVRKTPAGTDVTPLDYSGGDPGCWVKAGGL